MYKKCFKIGILAFVVLCCVSCKNEMVGQYLGRDETRADEIVLTLNADYSFIMEWIADGNYKNEPQKIFVGDWKKDKNYLILITKDNKIIYEEIVEDWTMAGNSFTMETYVFRNAEKDFFASDFNFTKGNIY